MTAPEVLIIGAGPAGSAAAAVLARAGHAVSLVDRPAGVRRALAESIPPSARRLLRALGMDHAVDAAGFERWRGNTVWWADAPPRVETFPPEDIGYQVERDRFDAVLRHVAASAGARVLPGVVRAVDLPSVHIETADGPVTIEAPWVIDASGRAGVIARAFRDHDVSHHTVALAGLWRQAAPWPPGQRGHALVASHAGGWAWSVPVAEDLRYVTVMVDPARSALKRDAPAGEVYRAALENVPAFAPLLGASTLVDGPWGADASLYTTRAHAGPGFLLAGDAAACIDPLSSFGVKKALASGWLAGIVVRTVIATPSMRAPALAFFEHRERQAIAGLRRAAARYAGAAGVHHPFWQVRASESAGDEGDDQENPAALAQDPGVRAALKDLQTRPEVRLAPGPQVRIEPRAVIRGDALVLDDHLVLPAWPAGVRYLRNIDLLRVVRLAGMYRDVGEMYMALTREQPGVGLPDFLGVLSTLVARGALRHLEE